MKTVLHRQYNENVTRPKLLALDSIYTVSESGKFSFEFSIIIDIFSNLVRLLRPLRAIDVFREVLLIEMLVPD